MCKFGLRSVGAPGLRFPVERRSLYSSFPFRRKTGGLPLCGLLAASVWSGFVALALAAVSFGPCARPESPPKGGGHLWWLSDRAYCAASWHRPIGIRLLGLNPKGGGCWCRTWFLLPAPPSGRVCYCSDSRPLSLCRLRSFPPCRTEAAGLFRPCLPRDAAAARAKRGLSPPLR